MFCFFIGSSQNQLTMNKWVKAWGYNPDGTVTIKYQVRVKNNTSNRLCNLIIGDDLTDAGFLQGSAICSATQVSTWTS